TTEWQHIVMTWEDGVGFNLYIDGVLDEPTLAMQNTVGTTALMDRFVLGDGAKAYWDGLIDEVAVWKATLTADEAAWLAENSIAGLGAGGGGSTLTTGLTGYWPLEAGDGTTAANTAGGEDAELHNGVEWVDDPDRGTVLSFDGVDGYADAGAETIPQMTQDNDFTWSVWINQGAGNGPNNVVLGNRYSPEGGDFAPREFIKYTPTKFEFHLDGGGQNCEYGDLVEVEGEWVHYVVVKTGDSFTHYSNGEEGESSTFTSELQNPQPFYFGGDKTNENWNGMLDDIAIWDRALSGEEIALLHSEGLSAAGPVEAPALSIVNSGDGTVTVTFEGKLQAAASVNGPWADVNESSPLTVEASEAMQYARAVNE
ncbi:MAG: LamG domain-containing protein, partial [Acidobacteria bacterium]|nr:LamG domain-containing protein [Acidobacteriota bacterium]